MAKTVSQMYVTDYDHDTLKKEQEKRGGTTITFIIEEWAQRFLNDGKPTPEEAQAVSHNVASRSKNRSSPIRTSEKAIDLLKQMTDDTGFNRVRVISLLCNRYA